MRSFGVEEEFLLVTDGGDLAALGADVVAAAARAVPGDGNVEVELKDAQAELGSAPSTSAGDIERDLRQLRATLAAAANGRAARLVALGTNPNKGRAATTAHARYLAMTDQFGTIARQQLTCGQHVHVSVTSRAEGVRVLDGLQPWLPVLRALASNSPFWQGEDTGYASFRTVLWNEWPTAGVTEPFGDEAGYDRRVAELIGSGAAMDDGMIYFDARLSAKFPTVEIRVADVSTDVATSVLIAVLCRALVERVAVRALAAPSPALLRAAVWRAARYGLSDRLVHPGSGRLAPAADVLAALLDYAGPALGGDADRAEAGVAALLAHGTGADRQRAAFARTGSLDGVVDDAAARTSPG
jgi:carboxylate-amine ligase